MFVISRILGAAPRPWVYDNTVKKRTKSKKSKKKKKSPGSGPEAPQGAHQACRVRKGSKKIRK